MLQAAEDYLRQRDVDAPKRSVELLMGRVMGISRLDLYLAHDRPVNEAERTRLRALIADRGRHVPVAHLLGDWEFFGLELEVTADVLVPRPETEHLAELAIERAPADARCLDLGTGSGAIAIALAAKRPDVTVVASEVSPAAAAVARRNVARHDLGDRVEVVDGETWQPLTGREPFDLLVSNPPYVDPAQPELLAPDVREFEPQVALFTEPGDPGSCYRAILEGVPDHVRAGGWILLETGMGASEAAHALLEQASFTTDVELTNDLAGVPRYLSARVTGNRPRTA